MTKDMAEIRRIIRARLEAAFDFLRIVDVRVREDRDFEGDRILLIDVIFKGEAEDLDAAALAGAVRQVRPALIENGEDGFPVFSFVAEREMSELSESARPH